MLDKDGLPYAEEDTLKTQVDGEHYKVLGLQPWEIVTANKLDFFEGTVLSYLLRWRNKDGIIDLEKSIHYLQHMIALAKQGHYGEQFIPKTKCKGCGFIHG